MRLLQTEITPLVNDVVHIDVRSQPFLWSPYHTQPSFHAHPELELVLILEGFGKRIIGNKIEPFEAGDMVFIGANVPHVWLSDQAFYNEDCNLKSKVIVTYFNINEFHQVFESVKEFEAISALIKNASKGIRIYGETKATITEKLITLPVKKGFERVSEMLQIMNIIATSHEKSFIVTSAADLYDNQQSSDRLIDVIRFIKENIHKHISLKLVADVACMTEQSFCRYFKKRTNKSLSHFVNDLRIEQSKKMLTQSDKTITDIAFLCGYNSSSHFCKVFKDHTSVSPYRYKDSINKQL